MAVEVQHDGPQKFALAGLDLNVPVDLVPPTKYSRATNVVSKIEGRLETRDGTTRIANVVAATPIHTIFRLTQFQPSVFGERLVGAGANLYTASLPNGNVFTPLAGGPSFDGAPLSIVQFRFDADPAVWAIIANSAGMMKRRAGYYQKLGVAPPTVQASASAGGAGLLNSSSGVGYDWRYTYLNEVTLSESNGSPTTLNPGGTTTSAPTSFTDPDVPADLPFTSPGAAIDGNPSSFADGQATASVTSSQNGSSQTNTVGCIWKGVQFSALQYSKIVLNVTSAIIIQNTANDPSQLSHSQASGVVQISYSTDGGMTWIAFANYSASRANTTDTVSLPTGTNLANIQVRALGIASAFSQGISGASAFASVEAQVYEISLSLTLATGQTLLLPLVNQSAKVCVAPPIDSQETAIRLYRRGGTLPDNWFQVGQFPVSSLAQGVCGAGLLEIDDNIPDSQAQIGPILPQDNFQPVSSVQAVAVPLPVIFGPYNGQLLACGDPARPESVYFCLNGNADIWPAENFVVVGNPGEQMMNGLVYALRCFVFSRERMFIMLPNITPGVTFTCPETSCRRGLKGRWAFAAGKLGIYFVSKDGFYRTAGGPEQNVSGDIQPLFPTREAPTGFSVHGYEAVDMSDENGLRCAFHNNEIWFFYTGLTSRTRQLLIYDEDHNRWRAGTYPDKQTIVYSEPSTSSSLLMGASDGDVYQVGGGVDGENAVAIPVNFRTGAFDQGRPLNLKEYLTVNIDIDPGGATTASPVVITPLINGETVTEAAIQVSGSGRQRVTLPLNQGGNEVYGYNIEFDFAWAGTNNILPVVYQYEILYRHEPAEVTHWELQPTSFGIEGYLHIRDIYLMLRSTSNVTLTVLIDDSVTPQVFTLPPTSGLKDKLYVQLLANKAKVYSFKLDSTAPFRIYADESEVRCKQWLSKLGYKNVPVIGREQVGRPFGVANV